MSLQHETTRQVLTDEIYEHIKSLLMDHEIQPGERILIDGLARDLKVSQTPIREALARLESEDLVVRKPLTGYSATSLLTLDELMALYDFRFMIEPRAIAVATKLLTVEGEERLKEELDRAKESKTGEKYAVYREMSEHDHRFHSLIVSLSKNTFMETAYTRAHCHLHMFRLNPTSAIAQKMALREHVLIFKAMISRDPKAASKAMTEHIENSRDRFLSFIIKKS